MSTHATGPAIDGVVSPWTLNRWVRLGVITPSSRQGHGSGYPHGWTEHDLWRLRQLTKLHAGAFGGRGSDGGGHSIDALRSCAEALQNVEDPTGLVLAYDGSMACVIMLEAVPAFAKRARVVSFLRLDD